MLQKKKLRHTEVRSLPKFTELERDTARTRAQAVQRQGVALTHDEKTLRWKGRGDLGAQGWTPPLATAGAQRKLSQERKPSAEARNMRRH